MHDLIYNTIKDPNGNLISIDWSRKTSEEGNEKVDLDYDTWLSQMKATERKIQQTTFQSRNIPGWMAQYRIGDVLYEFLYVYDEQKKNLLHNFPTLLMVI